jgi:hypothetical protein
VAVPGPAGRPTVAHDDSNVESTPHNRWVPDGSAILLCGDIDPGGVREEIAHAWFGQYVGTGPTAKLSGVRDVKAQGYDVSRMQDAGTERTSMR